MNKTSVAIIGYGYRGKYLSKLISQIKEFEIIAIADILPSMEPIEQGIYFGGQNSVSDMFDQVKPHIVFITSTWETHYKYAMMSVQFGCHVALEVKGALFYREYESIIEEAQQKGVKIYSLENTVFKKEIMAVSEMNKKQLFGKIVWAQGSYRHDLRKLMFKEQKMIWRTDYYYSKVGDIYPTHSIGPLLFIMGINDPIRFKTLASFASTSNGLISISNNADSISLGDVVTTIITTYSGAQIILHHNTTLPQPKSLPYEIQGTKGIWDYEARRIYIENKSPYEIWEDANVYIEEYKHLLWEKYEDIACRIDVHHNGMDYIMLRAILEDILGKSIYPISPEDMALWANISLWSEESIRENKTITF